MMEYSNNNKTDIDVQDAVNESYRYKLNHFLS